MKKSLYILVIFALLVQPCLGYTRDASAREMGEGVLTPEQTTLYVKPGGTGDCASWGSACELQNALSMAAPGDEIWVTQGVYKPTDGTDRAVTFSMESGVALYGGFDPDSEADTFEERDPANFLTVLSGDIGGDDITDPNGVVTDTAKIVGDNSYNVVTAFGVDASAILDGFTITAGNANGAHPDWMGGGIYNDGSYPLLANVTFSGNNGIYGGGMSNYHSAPSLENVTFSGNSATWGGGILNQISSPVLENVTFNGNRATQYGGGMENYVDSSPTLENVTFSGNTAPGGGGMYNYSNSSPTLLNVSFRLNTGNSGSGMYNRDYSSPEISATEFISNTAAMGGGMMNHNHCSPVLENVIFRGNTSSSHGGGMHNESYSSPLLTNVIFTGNTATNYGGGMYNRTNCSPIMENVTFSGNSANWGGALGFYQYCHPTLTGVTFTGNTTPYGASVMYNSLDIILVMTNAILWGNLPLQNQILNESGSTSTISHSDIQGGSAGDGNIDLDPLFMDANGADDIPGTSDDNPRLMPDSPAIDAGDNSAVSPGVTTDVDGNPRFFADVNMDLVPDLDANVDMGAYESQYGWYVNLGNAHLSAGQEYRTGFHTSRTISDTLAAYSIQPFLDADHAYALALASPDVPSRVISGDTVLSRFDTRWEIATGELLSGNDEMLKTLDMRFSAGLPLLVNHITYQTTAREHFTTAINAYLSLLDEQDYYDLFLAAQPERLSYLIDVNNPQPNPYHDVQRLADVAARESLAYVALAESYFRQNTTASKKLSEDTLRAGHDLASDRLALLGRLTEDWEDAELNIAYATAIQALTQNIAEMERIFEYLQLGKNPFGYHDGYIPFLIRYDNSADPENVWNFLNVYEEAYNKSGSIYDLAWDAHDALMKSSRQLDHDQNQLEAALLELVDEYQAPLGDLCGTIEVGGVAAIDLAGCQGGTIRGQVLVIQGALTRLGQAELEMENQLALVRIEQERAARVAGIHRATAIMYTEDGKELASLAEDEANLKYSKSDLGMGLDILGAGLSGFLGGAELGTNFNPGAGILFSTLNMALQAGKNVDERITAGKLADIAARREEIDARQKARVEYAEAEIVDVNSKALVKEYFLEYATLELDRAIAYNALQQELHKLNAMTAQVEYLLARWSEAKKEAFDIFYDPGARLYRDWLSEQAQERYDQALEWAFRSGRALDYEMGQSWEGADDIFEIVEINSLEDAFIQMNADFNDWKPTIPPEPSYTAIPLSQALGFADSWEMIGGVPVFTTAREKFNAFVSDPDNWVDMNGDGTAASLRLNFQTSIFNISEELNLFSTGVFNDKILRVAPVLIGDAAHLDPGSNNSSVRLKQLGTCYLRSKEAVIGGQDSFKAYDFEHAIKEGDPREARLNSYHEWINVEDLAESEIDTRGSLGMLWRSVGCTKWVLTIAKEGIDAENSDINFAYLNDILLFVKHRNFALETPGRAAKPTIQAVEPKLGVPKLMSEAEAAYRYSGTLLPEQPERMRPEQLTLYLEQSGSDAQGVIEAGGLLGFPELAEDGTGPALTGTMTGGLFNLTSEIYSGAGGITRTLTLTTTAVYTDGALIRGEYTQSILGLVPETVLVQGIFTLTQSVLTPVASFNAKPSTGPAPLPVSFLNWSQGEPTSYQWDFGDGDVSTEISPTHTYVHSGWYTVTLTVENLFGTNTLTETELISVTEPAAPVAYFSADPLSGPVPLEVTFTDQSAGGPTDWLWDFGDGHTSTLQNPIHTYEETGTFTVTLTVSNTLGTDTTVLPDYVHVYEPEYEEIYLPILTR